ncbi:CDP-alcohol phosphatidyltransferase family protein [bacterium]|nr:CDP-alcohol phosphatidyltransferase family protein [bacterium]
MEANTIAIINCSNEYSFKKIWGVSFCERILRRLSDLGIRHALLILSSNVRLPLRNDFKPRFPIEVQSITYDQLRMQTLIPYKAVLLMEGHAEYDNRLLKDVVPHTGSLRITNGSKASPLLVKLSSSEFESVKNNLTNISEWLKIIDTAFSSITTRSILDYNTYDNTLKSDTVPVLQHVTNNDELKALERYVHKSQSKVVLDFVAILIDKCFTWILVRPLSKTLITPNMLTLAIIAIQVLVVPVFFMGWIVAGLVLEWIMIILDSCDGKLARVTIRLSDQFGWIEHRVSYWSTSLWYFAVGWSLAEQNIDSPFAIAGAFMFILFWMHRMTVLSFQRTYGKSLYSYTPMDIRISYIVARRNINVFILTTFMFVGNLETGLIACLFWSMLGWLFHLSRLLFLSFKDGKQITLKKKRSLDPNLQLINSYNNNIDPK